MRAVVVASGQDTKASGRDYVFRALQQFRIDKRVKRTRKQKSRVGVHRRSVPYLQCNLGQITSSFLVSRVFFYKSQQEELTS